jgi:hypothetical protein
VINGRTHLEFAHSWPFALLIWRMLVVHERPTVRNGLVAGAAAVVCLSFNAYFLLIGGVAYAALIAGGLLFAWRDRVLGAALRAHAAGAAVVAAVLAAYAGLNATAGGDGEIRDYDLAELYVYSSRALHYVVPHPGSKLFLGAGDGWWETHAMSGLAESGHYLGLTVLALALVAVGAALLGRLSRAQARVTWLIAAAGVLAALFSAPPTFQAGGVTIHMPSWFVFEVLPTWRVYSRFGLLVMTAAALLAAIGLARLLRGRSPAVAAVLAAVVGTLVVLDLWTHPSPASSRVPAPAVYEAVEDLPPGIVAEYPLFQNAVPEYQFALYQGQHDHPILNYYNAGTRQELRALWIADLEDPDTAGQLALLGVRYVVLTLGPPPAGVPAPGEPGRGFRRLREQDGKAVYEVTAAPAASLTWPARGFAPPEGERDGRFAWMTEADGEIDVLARCRPCSGSVRLRVASFLRPRRVRIRDAGGRVRWEGTVGGGAPRSVEIPVRFGGELRLELEASPGPQSVRESTGAPDPRDLAIRVEEPRFVPAP